MYQIGDTVMHPSEGVCSVEDIRTMSFGAGSREYYILRPTLEKSSSTVYLPIERGNAILRKLLSRRDIVDMIHRSADYAGLWTDDTRLRKERFTDVLHSGEIPRIIQMIREIHEHHALRLAEGKKLPATDEHLLQEAERLLYQEFSYVLKMSQEETVAFIMRELGVPAAVPQ